jgi:hypothetical protein
MRGCRFLLTKTTNCRIHGMRRNGGTVKHKNPVIFTRGFQPEAQHYVTEIYEDLGDIVMLTGSCFMTTAFYSITKMYCLSRYLLALMSGGCLINLKNYNRPSYRLLSGRCFSGLAALDGFTKTLFGSCFALVRTVRVLAHYL